MSSLVAIHPPRIFRLLLALTVAFIGVGVLTLAGSMLLPTAANAAAAPQICSTAGEISIQLTNGSTRCVENSCQGVLGAEGRAAECSATKPPLNISVPDANSGISGVAPAPVLARESNVTSASKSSSGIGTGATLAWIFAGIGTIALLFGFGILLRARVRHARVEREAREAKRDTPVASA